MCSVYVTLGKWKNVNNSINFNLPNKGIPTEQIRFTTLKTELRKPWNCSCVEHFAEQPDTFSYCWWQTRLQDLSLSPSFFTLPNSAARQNLSLIGAVRKSVFENRFRKGKDLIRTDTNLILVVGRDVVQNNQRPRKEPLPATSCQSEFPWSRLRLLFSHSQAV